MTFGKKVFLPVEPASCLFIVLLGRKPGSAKNDSFLELYPSFSDELVKRPFSELRFRYNTLAPSDSIKSNLQGYSSTSPAQAGSTVQHPRMASGTRVPSAALNGISTRFAGSSAPRN